MAQAMSELASINIAHAIACDDIRQEINGKFILIGVYSGNLGLPVFPAHVALGFWMMAKPSQKGDYHIRFRVQGPAENEVTVSGQMIVHVQEKEDMALVIPPMPISIPSPGEIILQYQAGDGPWNTICRLEARLVPLAPPPG